MSVTNCTYICDEKASCLLAALIAKQANAGDCFALYGDLGTGKSTFARAFIQALCGDVSVASPTFTISQSYQIEHRHIWHYDLYRLQSAEELFEIGLEDTLNDAINLIEWPEIAKTLLPAATMHITFAFADNPYYRHIQITRNNI